jgi:BlaI family transcriptional regulator, penicillinase repressor
MMGRPAQDITDSELAVLRILWDRETATIRQLTDILYPGGEAAQYATVQKLLDRMEAKGYVGRDRSLYVHMFHAVLDRDQLIGRRLRSLAEMLCDGSLTPLLTHLARAGDLTEEDRLALRAIMDEFEADPIVKDLPDKAPAGTSRAGRPRSSGSGRGGNAR